MIFKELLKAVHPTNSSISILTLNRPQFKNALGSQLISDLKSAIKHYNSDPSTKILVLNSSSNAFSSGADLKERIKMDLGQTKMFVDTLRDTFQAFSKLPMITIACMDGVCLGGGLELALACDFRVGGLGLKAGFPEVKLGIIPGAGGTQRVSRLIGYNKAKEMILSGRIYNSEQALALGVCDQIGQDPLELSLTFAEEISKNAPLALRMAKKSIDCGGVNTFKWEQDCYQVVLDSEDRLEGLRAFQEKRSPNYIGK